MYRRGEGEKFGWNKSKVGDVWEREKNPPGKKLFRWEREKIKVFGILEEEEATCGSEATKLTLRRGIFGFQK